ncbi:MAG: hypothetical protein AB7U38_01605 [Hyphomicrobiales bacterium]
MNDSAAAQAGSGSGGEQQVSFSRSVKEPLLILAIFVGLLSTTILAAAGFALYEGVEIEWWLAAVFILAFLPALSIGGYMAWKARTDRRAQVTVSASGLEIPSLTARSMLWDDISRLSAVEQYYRGSRQGVTLAVFANDPASLGPRSSGIMRAFNRWYYGTPLAYNLEPLEGEPEDVIEAIRRLAPARLLAASALGTSEDRRAQGDQGDAEL